MTVAWKFIGSPSHWVVRLCAVWLASKGQAVNTKPNPLSVSAANLCAFCYESPPSNCHLVLSTGRHQPPQESTGTEVNTCLALLPQPMLLWASSPHHLLPLHLSHTISERELAPLPQKMPTNSFTLQPSSLHWFQLKPQPCHAVMHLHSFIIILLSSLLSVMCLCLWQKALIGSICQVSSCSIWSHG